MPDNTSSPVSSRQGLQSIEHRPVGAQARAAAAPLATYTPITTDTVPKRIMGLDVTRGLAVIGMMAVHIYDNFYGNGSPTPAFAISAGRSAATFVLMAGVSLALITGKRQPLEGRARTAAAAALAVRAMLIGLIGFSLAYTNMSQLADVTEILQYYGMLFLLGILVIGFRARTLACLAIVIGLVSPVFLLLVSGHVPDVTFDSSPTFSAFLHPYRLLVGLTITGEYPAIPYMAYICAGMAIGRLDLSSTRVAIRLLAGGVAMALTAWFTSSFLLLHMGGLQALRAAGAAPANLPASQVRDYLLWQPNNVSSWWWLAVRAPYTITPFNLMHTIGVSMAVLGAMLLLSRVAAPVLKPLAAAGGMVLTIYTVHLIYLCYDPLSDYETTSYVIQVSAALIFAILWRRYMGQGPLEKSIAVLAGRARRAVAAHGTATGRRPVPSS